MARERGKFITFEGIDGVGKTTQIQKVSRFLDVNYIPHVVTREPGGTDSAELIRDILCKKNPPTVTKILLYYAARYDHINNFILPNLENGKWVLSDRFDDSSKAYQIDQGHNILLNFLSTYIVRDLKPDLTFLFNLDPSARTNLREETIVDSLVETGKSYQDIALKEKDRWQIISAYQSEDIVTAECINKIKQCFGKKVYFSFHI